MSTMTDEEFASLTLDNPELRLDEHDRCCLWCAKNDDRCLRAQSLIEAIERLQVSASPNQG